MIRGLPRHESTIDPLACSSRAFSDLLGVDEDYIHSASILSPYMDVVRDAYHPDDQDRKATRGRRGGGAPGETRC